MDRSEKIILFLFIGIIGFALCVVFAFGGVLLLGQKLSPQLVPATEILPTVTTQPEVVITPIPTVTSAQISSAQETLQLLDTTVIPATDLVLVAEKFQGKKDIPRTLTTLPINYQVGDEAPFWVLNTDTSINTQVTARLAYETKDVYFWIADGVSYEQEDLKELVETIARKIYPTDQEFFGKEWIPGVDNDPHLFILYAPGLGDSVAGYMSSTDGVLTEAHPYTNEHEMFTINSDIQTLSDPYTYGVAAHELQHLIHDYHDSNEESWLNEGFSELAVFLNGYETGGFDSVFSYDPDIQLNEWPDDSSMVEAHYGAGFLFTTYMLDRFGEDFTKAVVADKKNGLSSIDAVFADKAVVDPINGKAINADRFFQDWTLANYLQDDSVSDGRYVYHNYNEVPAFSDSELISECENSQLERSVHQYGTDYIHFNCSGDHTLQFVGQETLPVIPIDPKDGDFYLWSNKADASDMTMTHEFDFTQVSGPLKMTFDTWYDLETDYDFLYLMASEDGESWQLLNPPSCTSTNLTGNNYGCSYNGNTPTWKKETVDLSAFAGKKIWLRFEYVTDAAVTGEGFAIDNISIPQIDYSAGFETDEDGWDLAGFVRMNNRIPQTFLVSTIQYKGGDIIVTKYQLAPGEKLLINGTNGELNDLVLIVSGTARYSRQEAIYTIEIE